MDLTFLDVLLSVIALLILVVPAFILAKCKMIGERVDSSLSNLVLYACLPFLMFTCFQKDVYTARIGYNMLITFGISSGVMLVMAVIVRFCVKGKSEEKLKVLRFASVFGNCGFMGIPFLQTLFFGSEILGEILIYAAVVNSAFNIISWTLGVYLISGDVKQMSIKKIVLNPVIIATVLGFVLFIAVGRPVVDVLEPTSVGYSIVSKIMSSLEILGSTVTPLSMFVIGIRLARIDLKRLFTEKLAYLNSAIKLVGMAILVMAVALFLPIDVQVKYVVFLLLIMPTATSTTLFAIKFNGDADFGAICVLQATVLSIITIPLMYLLFNTLLGLV